MRRLDVNLDENPQKDGKVAAKKIGKDSVTA